ncbi:MAG: hypothetical protein M1308_14055 [Actinobacteria bacterium]|nr:hypothetical protein [Actinomycetota bacterium]
MSFSSIKISALPTASNGLVAGDIIPIVRGGVTDKAILTFSADANGNISILNPSLTPGYAASLVVTNVDTTNPDSNAYLSAATAGLSGGDPYAIFTIIGGNTWALGADNSNGGKFVIANSNSLGTNDVLILGSDLSTTLNGLTNIQGALNIFKSLPGGNLAVTIQNTSNTTSSTVGLNIVTGASAGNPQLAFTGATTWALGTNNADSNSFVISNFGALGTNNAIRFDTSLNSTFSGNMNVTAAAVGSPLTIQIYNTDNTSGTSDALLKTQVGGASGGDPHVLYTIGGGVQNWVTGIDNSDSDAFLFAASAALGTTNVLRLGTDLSAKFYGTVTMPSQPAFSAYLATTAINKTGLGTSYQLGTDALTEIFDQSNNFNINGTFTAPVTGKYTLSAGITFANMTAGIVDTCTIAIITTARTYTQSFPKPAGVTQMGVNLGGMLVDMTAGDTAVVAGAVTGEAGDTVSILGGSAIVTYINGKLDC